MLADKLTSTPHLHKINKITALDVEPVSSCKRNITLTTHRPICLLISIKYDQVRVECRTCNFHVEIRIPHTGYLQATVEP